MKRFLAHKPRLRPGLFILVSFATAVLLGTSLLLLPGISRQNPLGIVDALFTATSAVCVTGLIVVDTGQAFTLWGQLVILGLIQIGGLGIVTLSALVFYTLTENISLRDSEGLLQTMGRNRRISLTRFLRYIVIITFVSELVGALLLFAAFLPSMSLGQAFYFGLFHAVSAFCNAGFSLFPDSLIGYQSDLFVNLVLMILIVEGGLGFTVLVDLGYAVGQWRWRRNLTLHSRLVIYTTVFLLVTGTLLFLFFEQHHILEGQPWHNRLLIALFQSVTTRTAGFSSVAVAQLSSATLFFMVLFMFIGGGSGSCAGGIKTNTFGVLLGLLWGRMRGYIQVELLGRRIPEPAVSRAIALVVLASLLIAIVLMTLLVTEQSDLSLSQNRGRFLELAFEVVSASGTVGLSTGVTQTLSTSGKLLIVFLMFAGRVGPLTLAVLLRSKTFRQIRYAEADVLIG